MVEDIGLLKRSPLFKDLDEPALIEVARRFHEESYKADEFLFFEGDPADKLWIGKTGQIKILKHSESGQEVILLVITPGELFGAAGTWGEEVYPASAQAQTACTVLTMHVEDFTELMHRFPPIALAVITVIKDRLKEAHEMMRRLSAERVERRIAHTLLKLAEKVGKRTAEGVDINMPLSRQDLASMTGTTVESVSRVLSKWQHEGLVKTGREHVVIVQPHRLVVLAEDLNRQ